MWIVILHRRWVYLEYKKYRYETKWKILAYLVYNYYFAIYVMSMFPVRTIKMYKVEDNVVDLKTYIG